MKEIELKFLLDADAAVALGRGEALAALRTAPAETRSLRTVYYDTADQALGEAGVALRLRHDGERWTQTVKCARTHSGGLSEATECNAALPDGAVDTGAIDDEALRSEVEGLIGGARLAPVFETRIRRETHRLGLPYLGTVELALDDGEIRADGGAAPIREAEFELIQGSPRALFEAARRMIPERGVRLSTLNKAERGALLSWTGAIEPAPAPRNANRVPLERGWTAEQGAHRVLSECLGQIVANVDTVARCDHPEGPHQLRVGLRRLRSALQLFDTTLAGPLLPGIKEEARWLGREVGRLRDLDVALGEIVLPEMEAERPDPGFALLADALRAHAGQVRAELRETLAGPRVLAFLLDLTEYTAARGWLDPNDWEQTARLARPLPDAAAEALDRRLARAAKRAEGIADLGIEQRHDLRKRLKELRYGVEFFAPLYPEKKVKPFLKRLKALQDIFGDLNDAAMAEDLFRDPEGPAARSVDAARAAGFLIGVRSERAREAWTHAREHWKALKDQQPFWR